MISIRQYLFSIGNSRGLTRTLGEIDACRDANGHICYTAGNSAVVFKIRHAGRICALRCYTRPARHLREIYGEGYLPEELFVFHDSQHGKWTDVVLCDWVEGETLHKRILEADAEELARLAEAFGILALRMVCDDKAHGDLKPENIIVQDDGTLRPIDMDASFLPSFAGQESPELGTSAFQHPTRTAADFDARLDDFSIALISTSLRALALDPSLCTRYDVQDALLIDPRQLPHDPALREILTLFERQGQAAAYRIARLLQLPTLRLPNLPSLLQYTTRTVQHDHPQTPPELFVEHGLWGYRDPATGAEVIPPLYDCGFDFTEGSAAVRLGRTWHFIDTQGHPLLHCLNAESIKPFRNGRARVLEKGIWHEIDCSGQKYILEY